MRNSYYMKSKDAKALDAALIATLIASMGIDDAEVATSLQNGTRFQVDTVAGRLKGALYLSDDAAGRRTLRTPAWLHLQFDDPKAAMQAVTYGSLNTHSGKWNYHFGNNNTYLIQLEYMCAAIRALDPVNFTIKSDSTTVAQGEKDYDAFA